jgi:hypothetical protein
MIQYHFKIVCLLDDSEPPLPPHSRRPIFGIRNKAEQCSIHVGGTAKVIGDSPGQEVTTSIAEG